VKRTPRPAGVALLLFATGCNVINSDSGPTKTEEHEIDSGPAETVRAEIRMGAGELHLQGGGTKLLAGSFRYSERIGRPTVRYDVTGSRGLLSVESPKNASLIGKMVNEWALRMGSQAPLEMSVKMGGGTASLDVSSLPLRSIEVEMGAGEMKLSLGKYTNDVTVLVKGGAGNTEIRLPKDMGAAVDAKLGIGSIDTSGLTKRDGKYYNQAYAEGKPAIQVEVRGGVGDIKLNVGK
jgi:hypothetical protein